MRTSIPIQAFISLLMRILVLANHPNYAVFRTACFNEKPDAYLKSFRVIPTVPPLGFLLCPFSSSCPLDSYVFLFHFLQKNSFVYLDVVLKVSTFAPALQERQGLRFD
ncbi:hypothetical protein, partial [Bacteroides pyogenes]|uniref:hypothetical protein n=1 Tax=Bacteroides pyogenes TaxID=310300 RepID=UPI002A919D3E